MYTNLISADELAVLLDAGNVRVFDARDDLMRPGWGHEAYLESHIAGACYVRLKEDLSGPPVTDHGRHPMPTAAALVQTFSRLGIGRDSQVVVYDQRDGSVASRMWWLLRYMGHDAVAVLEGGFPAWEQAGLPVSAGEERPQPAAFAGEPRSHWVVGIDELAGVRRLLDARHAARYRGEHEPIDRVAGHIPSAHNLPFAGNLDEHGRFLERNVVRENFERALGGVPAEDAVYSCGSGVTACHLALTAHWLGLADGRIYVGSFSEWSGDPARAVATGPEPGTL